MTERMRKGWIIMVLAGICALPLRAQHTNILISNTDFPNEPSIVMDPANTAHLVAGANLDNVYYSTDGGLSWTEGKMSSSYGVWGDPVIIVDTASAFYFFHLSAPLGYADPSWLDRIVCQKQDSIGKPWSDGSYTDTNGITDHDKQWAVVDPRNNTIYMTWTVFDEYGSYASSDSSHILFSRSTDGGQSWSAPLRINRIGGDCIDEDNTVEGAVPAVGPNGEVYVSWSGPAGIRFDRSADGGNTWLDQDILVSDQPGGWDFSIPGIMRCNGLPITACDLSNGPHRGNIYVNWTDQRNGATDTDVWLARSTDGGNTWSAPLRVNDDPPGRHQFFTWMCVDQATGHLWFVFYDRRNTSGNNTDVYMAVSRDGGQNFQNFRVSDSSFYPYSSVFFGDYTNITAHNNVVRPIWTRLHNDELSIHTAIVDVDYLSSPESMAPAPEIETYPNPFTESTYISFKLHAAARVNLNVCDLYGKRLICLIGGETRPAGKYVEHFDPEPYGLAPGVYYFELITGDRRLVRKMVLN